MRRNCNIRHFFVSSDLYKKREKIEAVLKGHHKCRHCSIYDHTIEGDSIYINNRNIQLKDFTSCASKNIIYAIKCPCPFYYIGSSCHTCICEHRSRIKLNILEAPLTAHLQIAGHAYNDFQCIALEQIKQIKYERRDLQRVLLKREAFWTPSKYFAFWGIKYIC